MAILPPSGGEWLFVYNLRLTVFTVSLPFFAIQKEIISQINKKSEPISDLENLVRIICVWCTRQESNLWPSESESDALSN